MYYSKFLSIILSVIIVSSNSYSMDYKGNNTSIVSDTSAPQFNTIKSIDDLSKENGTLSNTNAELLKKIEQLSKENNKYKLEEKRIKIKYIIQSKIPKNRGFTDYIFTSSEYQKQFENKYNADLSKESVENFINRIKEISTELRSHPIYRYIAKQSNKIKYLQRTNEYWKDKAISLLASLQSQNNIKYTNLEDKLKIFYCTLLKYQDNITEYQSLYDSNTIDKDIKLLIEVCNRLYNSKDKIEKIFDCEYLSNIELEISKYSHIIENQWKEIQNLAKNL